MTIDQLKFNMVDMVKYRHFMAINSKIIISILILTGCFILMSILTEGSAVWCSLAGLSIVAVIVSLMIRTSKYDSYDYDVESKDKFMKNYLSFSDYQELKRSAEIFLGYRKDSVVPIKPIKEKKTVNLPVPNDLSGFLNALKDFYYLDIEDQENVILSLKGDQKIRDRLKPVFKKFQGYTTENSLVELVLFLQVIKTKVF